MARDGARNLAPARVRLAICAVVGVLGGLLAAVSVSVIPALLLGWDAAAAVYILWGFWGARRMDAAATGRLAVSEDPGRAAFDLLLLIASAASLVAVGLVVTAGNTPVAKNMSALLAVVSVLVGWSLVHTVFTERYARLYYHDTIGGIEFNEQEQPRYLDFMYLAFTVGMTYQVSDTQLTSKAIRAAVLRHALLSYIFGSVIIAATINLLVSLAH